MLEAQLRFRSSEALPADFSFSNRRQAEYLPVVIRWPRRTSISPEWRRPFSQNATGKPPCVLQLRFERVATAPASRQRYGFPALAYAWQPSNALPRLLFSARSLPCESRGRLALLPP